MSVYASFSVVLYRYFKYLGLVIISLSLFIYASLSYRPIILFVIVMSKNYAYVCMKRINTRDTYTSDRYEYMSSDWPWSGLYPCASRWPVSVVMGHPPPLLLLLAHRALTCKERFCWWCTLITSRKCVLSSIYILDVWCGEVLLDAVV